MVLKEILDSLESRFCWRKLRSDISDSNSLLMALEVVWVWRLSWDLALLNGRALEKQEGQHHVSLALDLRVSNFILDNLQHFWWTQDSQKSQKIELQLSLTSLSQIGHTMLSRILNWEIHRREWKSKKESGFLDCKKE